MQTWFITGASSGLGRSLAETVLQAGAQAVLTARDPQVLAPLLQQYPAHARAVALDLTDPASITAAVQAGCECFGQLDVVVNNAGYGLLAALEETDDAHLQRNLQTNLLGPLQVMRAILPSLRAQGRGHLISISAIAAFANHVGFSVYGAAKAGLEAACEAVAEEVAAFGIKVTVVSPGPFRTEFIGRSLEAVASQPEYQKTVGKFHQYLQRIDGRQPGDPQRAAQAIWQIAQTPKPPFRLVLGKYAYDRFAQKLRSIGQELEEWKDIGLPTDFPPT